MKRVGPELKMPKFNKSDLKVPPVLVDLYWDLWDRRLLPLVALVIVAIVAVPFVLGSGSEEPEEPVSTGIVASLATEAESAASLNVVQDEPGLRDYHKRLAHRSPIDPFKQRFTAPVLTARLGAGSSSPTTTAPTSTSPTVPAESSSGASASAPAPEPAPSSSPTPEATPPSSGVVKHHLVIYTTGINVRLTRWGGNQAEDETGSEGDQSPQASVRKELRPLTPLPGDKAPVVTYMGIAAPGKVLLLVSNKVGAIMGEGNCVQGKVTGDISPEVVGEGACQLLEVEVGFPDTFVYGANATHYMVKVLKIEPIILKRF